MFFNTFSGSLYLLSLLFLGELPEEVESLFEAFYDDTNKVWKTWNSLVPEYKHDPERKYNEILVPTVDTTRTEWLLRLQVGIKRPVLLVGETGTSKSATVANFLRSLDGEVNVSNYTLTFYSF